MIAARLVEGRAVVVVDPEDLSALVPVVVQVVAQHRRRGGAAVPVLAELVRACREASAMADLANVVASGNAQCMASAGVAEWFTVKQVSDLTGLAETTVRHRVRRGFYPGAARIGERSWAIPLEALVNDTED
ncbi:MAG: hypothetical protein R2715_15100 [Ilumatobacteraceae bacterium]